MININYIASEPKPTVFLKDIPTGTTFTGIISGHPNRLFLKLGKSNYESSEYFGTCGRIFALDSATNRIRVDCMWDCPDCPVNDYVVVDIEITVKTK